MTVLAPLALLLVVAGILVLIAVACSPDEDDE